MTTTPDDNDPILRRRARMAVLATGGQRLGYLIFGLAVVMFVVGLLVGYSGSLTTAIVTCLIVGSLVLAPAIILGYAVKAADREDRGLPHGH